MRSPTRRAMMSLPPLGANGTTNVIGRAGNASVPCA
jgi:hypothetical protein